MGILHNSLGNPSLGAHFHRSILTKKDFNVKEKLCGADTPFREKSSINPLEFGVYWLQFSRILLIFSADLMPVGKRFEIIESHPTIKYRLTGTKCTPPDNYAKRSSVAPSNPNITNKSKGRKMRKLLTVELMIVILASAALLSGCSTQQVTRPDYLAYLDTVKAGQFDTGKMWTFDYPPMDYLAKTYDFVPTKEWFEKARLSALRLPGCTASFVSEDGLVMTNHHCARGSVDRVTRKGENLADSGFYAKTLEEERKVPRLYIDQLVLLEDVTAEVQQAFESGKTDEEKVGNRDKKTREIQERYSKKFKETTKDSMVFSVVTFYNGGKYALYGYKRYIDLRLVFAPETMIGFFGGDPDNFTYPRYDLDMSFFRVYDNDGKPLKTKNVFRWSNGGAKEGDAVFVVGNPGRTSRLQTYAQLEYNRDYPYPYTLTLLDEMVRIYSDLMKKHPDRKSRYQNTLFGYSNSQKSYVGRLGGLRDPYLMAKKRDFERKFKEAVLRNPTLKSKYASIWDEIEQLQGEKAKLFGELNALNVRGLGRSAYFSSAADLVEFAHQMKMPDDKRAPRYKGAELDSLKARTSRSEIDVETEREVLASFLKYLKSTFGDKYDPVNRLLGGKASETAALDLSKSAVTSDKERVKNLLNGNPDDILSSKDPLISYVVQIETRAKEVRDKYSEIQSKEAAKVQLLGKAIYEVYGTNIPPDATFTLRLADGVVKSYEYNGTIAPPVTTVYGMYDRYYSFGRKDPWDLPDRWKNPPPTFDLKTPMNFIMTSDIIGGNSGSPVVNKNLEVVGLIFDGNIESLPGDFIFTEDKNRAVAVHSAGILEALDQIYKADRIVKELKAGKIEP